MDMMEDSQAKNNAVLAALVKMAFWNSMTDLEINVPKEWYGKSIIEIYEPLQRKCNFLWDCILAEPFTRERIIWLLMQK